MIQIQQLTKIFQTGTEVAVLRGIDMHVEHGDIFGIIGMSGAGKSTLLRCISLLETPTTGTVLIEGRDIARLRGRELIEMRKKVGVIFQGYNLLMQRSVRDNVTFPLELDKQPRERMRQRADELLQLVGLRDKAAAYPSQLSGGQKQRVAIARALANHPDILLCDEPTSALDSLTTQSILDLLVDINRKLGVTIVIITHEIGVVNRICNKVAVINEGVFVEQGNTREVFDHPKSDVTRMLLGLKGETAQ